MSYAFVDAPLDRAEHLRTDSAALAALWPDAGLIVLDDDDHALVGVDGRLRSAPGTTADRPETAVFLGLDRGRAWFARRLDDNDPPGLDRVDLRSAAASWPANHTNAFAQARAVLHWRRTHRYCGRCGNGLKFERAGWLGVCSGCGQEHYPRTDPAVIVAVSDGPRLLLGRSPGWAPNRWSVLAGFVEPGESLEQTVAREVFEESQVRVLRTRYMASQPWPFPSSLMLGFEAEAQPDEPKPNDELESVRWFDTDTIGAALAGDFDTAGILLSPPTSISRWLIGHWYRQRVGACADTASSSP